MTEEGKVKINIEKFVLFHKMRIELLKKLVKEKKYGRLIFQISFLGFESLSKFLYQDENNPKNRFIELLSKVNIGKNEAERMWQFWRCPLTHEGCMNGIWTALEAWNEEDIGFISFLRQIP